MTADANREASGSDDREATMPTDPAETTNLTGDLDAEAQADEVYVLPRSTRRSGEIPLGRVMSNDAAAYLFGMPNVVRDINKIVIPDMDAWKRDMQPAFEAIHRMVMPDMTDWKRRVLPSMEALIEGLKPSLDAVHSTINMTGITDALSIFGEHHAQMMKSLSPSFNAATVLAPLISQMSGLEDLKRDVMASHAMQWDVTRPVVDQETMLGIASSLSLVADVASRISEINPSLNVEEFEEAALQAASEVDEDFDPDSPPTPEEIKASDALVRLVIQLRPDISNDLALRRGAKWMTKSGGLLLYSYLYFFHTQVFVHFTVLVFILSTTNSGSDIVDRILAPSAYKDDDESDS